MTSTPPSLSLKERIAELEKISKWERTFDPEVMPYSSGIEIGSSKIAKQAMDTITELQKIIQMQREALDIVDCEADSVEAPNLECNEAWNCLRTNVKNALHKTQSLLG